jgi:hypothetical protein
LVSVDPGSEQAFEAAAATHGLILKPIGKLEMRASTDKNVYVR